MSESSAICTGRSVGIGEKRGGLEEMWRLAPRTNRVVVVVRGPECTGDVGGSVGVCLCACLSLSLGD